MINYQLPNGRTVKISLDVFLKMSDDDLNRLNDQHLGECSNNPYDLSLDPIETIDEDLDIDD